VVIFSYLIGLLIDRTLFSLCCRLPNTRTIVVPVTVSHSTNATVLNSFGCVHVLNSLLQSVDWLCGLLLHSTVWLLLLQVIEFADDVSKRLYEEAYEAFKARHLTRDQFVEFSAKNDLPNFVKRLSVRDPDYDIPTWMSSTCFCMASCCCLSWPYRWMLNSSVSSYSYRIVKKVLVRPGPIVSQPQATGDFQPPPASAPIEPHAPPLPIIYTDDYPSDNVYIPIIPSDHIPSAPPPSYDEFAANPNLFGTTKRAVHESIPMYDMRK